LLQSNRQKAKELEEHRKMILAKRVSAFETEQKVEEKMAAKNFEEKYVSDIQYDKNGIAIRPSGYESDQSAVGDMLSTDSDADPDVVYESDNSDQSSTDTD
jgi:hypothetical protein